MNSDQPCPSCGKPLLPNAPQGLCPDCLMKVGLGTGVDPGPATFDSSAPASSQFEPPSVEELAPNFPQLEIQSLIGRGGMGAVYKARQTQLDRTVALKILPPDLKIDGAFADRFVREAQALAKLHHPHIVTLFEFGQVNGLFYFLMEYVDGLNLRQLLTSSRITPKEALAIVPQICEALQYAHDRGIVHRDIKPENILLNQQGQVKIADFGVARIMDMSSLPAGEGETEESSANAGRIVGTPQYMAPEQSFAPGEVDHRADIYALGVVFYQMLTGEMPSGRIEPPSRHVSIDVRIDEIVMRALEKNPDLRFQNVSEIKTQVETLSTPAAWSADVSGASFGTGAPLLLLQTESLFATEEHFSTAIGTLKMHEGLGILSLYANHLVFSRNGAVNSIPLNAIRRLGICSYPRAMSPGGLISLFVEYDGPAGLQRYLFIPSRGWFSYIGTCNRRVMEWYRAVLEAIVKSTGTAPEHSDQPKRYIRFSGSAGILAVSMFLVPVVVAGFLLFGMFTMVRPGGTFQPIYPGLAIAGFLLVAFIATIASIQRRHWKLYNKVAEVPFGESPDPAAVTSSEVARRPWSFPTVLAVLTLVLFGFVGLYNGIGNFSFLAIPAVAWLLYAMSLGRSSRTNPAGGRSGCGLWAFLIATVVGGLLLMVLGLGLSVRSYRTTEHVSQADTGAVVHYWTTEADADLLDQLIPPVTRTEGSFRDDDGSSNVSWTTATVMQTTEIDHDVMAALFRSKSKLLADKRRHVPFNFWPRLADGHSYVLPDRFGIGMINGFVAVRKEKDGMKLRLEYGVNLGGIPGGDIQAQIRYEGQAPAVGNVRVFITPYTRQAGKIVTYLVVGFQVNDNTETQAASMVRATLRILDVRADMDTSALSRPDRLLNNNSVKVVAAPEVVISDKQKGVLELSAEPDTYTTATGLMILNGRTRRITVSPRLEGNFVRYDLEALTSYNTTETSATYTKLRSDHTSLGEFDILEEHSIGNGRKRWAVIEFEKPDWTAFYSAGTTASVGAMKP